MFSIAALLVGGASVEKASIGNVFLGVILFHTMFIVAPRTGTVITGDSMIGEYFRVFVSYAVITVALVMYEAKKRKDKSAAGQQLAADQLAEEEAKQMNKTKPPIAADLPAPAVVVLLASPP